MLSGNQFWALLFDAVAPIQEPQCLAGDVSEPSKVVRRFPIGRRDLLSFLPTDSAEERKSLVDSAVCPIYPSPLSEPQQ